MQVTPHFGTKKKIWSQAFLARLLSWTNTSNLSIWLSFNCLIQIGLTNMYPHARATFPAAPINRPKFQSAPTNLIGFTGNFPLPSSVPDGGVNCMKAIEWRTAWRRRSAITCASYSVLLPSHACYHVCVAGSLWTGWRCPDRTCASAATEWLNTRETNTTSPTRKGTALPFVFRKLYLFKKKCFR